MICDECAAVVPDYEEYLHLHARWHNLLANDKDVRA